MANEVEIVVTSRDRSGPGLAAARARYRQFGADVGQTMAKAGKSAGQDLGGGIKDGIKDGADKGSRIVSGFTGSVLESFSRLGPGMGAAVTVGLLGAAASAGTIAGAITLAVGGAITGIGVVSAAQSVRVRREWADTGRDLKASLADAAAPLEESAIRAAGVTRQTFGRLKPFLTDFFAGVRPSVDRFVQSIGDGVASLGPALEPVKRGYSAVLDAISARSPAIFGALRRSIENLGRTAEEHADDIAYAFQFVATAVEKTTVVIDRLADAWDRFTSDIEAADQAGRDWGRSVGEALVSVYEKAGINTDRMKEMKEEWAAADAAAANSSGVKDAGRAASNLGSAAQDASAGLRNLAAEMEELTGPALDAAEAQVRVEEAIDAATESIRENGRTLNVNTEKGRANKDALLGMARAAQRHIASMQAEKASTEAITTAYGRYRNQLMRALRQAGLTRGAAEKLTDAWLKTPESVLTHARANISDVQRKITDAKRRLRDPKLTRPERTRIRAEISQLRAQVRAARAALNSLQNRTVTVYVRTVGSVSTYSAGGVRASSNAHGGIIGGIGAGRRRFQDGGIAGSGSSLAMVGEQGPELVRLPFGSQVTAAGQTRAQLAAAGGGGGGGEIHITLNIAGTTLGELIIDPLRKSIRTRGGNVQAVLGRG